MEEIQAAEPEVARKIAIVKAAIGYSLPRHTFHNAALAEALGVALETVSRKRNGKATMKPDDWARLFDHFNLAGSGLTPEIFQRSPAELEAALVEAGVGIHGDATLDRLLQMLLDLSAGQNAQVLTGRIAIERIGASRRGGIGGEAAQGGNDTLMERDKVRLHLTCPADGTLVVINHGPRRDITCLVPSSFEPDPSVAAGPVSVPDTPDCDHFPVARPFGAYRLFAIWFAQRPNLALLRANQPQVQSVTPRHLQEILRAIDTLAAKPRAVMVASKDYQVAEY